MAQVLEEALSRLDAPQHGGVIGGRRPQHHRLRPADAQLPDPVPVSRVLADQLAGGSGRGGLEAGHDLTAEARASQTETRRVPAPRPAPGRVPHAALRPRVPRLGTGTAVRGGRAAGWEPWFCRRGSGSAGRGSVEQNYQSSGSVRQRRVQQQQQQQALKSSAAGQLSQVTGH